MRIAPSLLFGIKIHRKPGKLLPIDLILFNALRMYRDGLCKGCGQPAAWAWDIRNSRYFTLDPNPPNCVVCELIEGDDDKPEPGDKRRIKNLMFEQ